MKYKTIATTLFFVCSYMVNSQNSSQKNSELITVQEIMSEAFRSSNIVMMNEAHSGQKRNIRTRIIGQLALPKAHAEGVRILAMEALTKEFADKANSTRKVPQAPSNFGYLHQPEMRNLMQLALDLGWELVAYEAYTDDKSKLNNSPESINWREKEQANNLAKILKSHKKGTKILVWCGNSHLNKKPAKLSFGDFYPMGYQFWKITGVEPFTIDQASTTVDFAGDNSRFQKWIVYEEQLKNNFYGTMGTINRKNKSAKIFSLHNQLE